MENSMQTATPFKKEVKSHCEKHGEFTGFEINLSNLGYTKKATCPECLKITLAKQESLALTEKTIALKRNVINAGVPLRFREVSFTSYQPKSVKDAARLSALTDFADNFKTKEAQNVFLFGDVGLGKTHLACSLATVLLSRGYSVVYTNTTSLLADQKDSMFDRNVSNSEFMNRFTSCHFLILDEFGLSSFTEHEKTFLHTVLNERYERILPTMIIGNIKPDTIGELIGDRAARRLGSSLLTIVLDGGAIING